MVTRSVAASAACPIASEPTSIAAPKRPRKLKAIPILPCRIAAIAAAKPDDPSAIELPRA